MCVWIVHKLTLGYSKYCFLSARYFFVVVQDCSKFGDRFQEHCYDVWTLSPCSRNGLRVTLRTHGGLSTALSSNGYSCPWQWNVVVVVRSLHCLSKYSTAEVSSFDSRQRQISWPVCLYSVSVLYHQPTIEGHCLFFFFSYSLLPPGVGVLGPSAEPFSILFQLVHFSYSFSLLSSQFFNHILPRFPWASSSSFSYRSSS